MQELDDIALLRKYVNEKSEEAFATLVARHVNKVYSVALRHTCNPHSAKEIAQAVFVIFAKKSGQFNKGVIVSGWLYETARLTAITFIRSEIRRTWREQEAHMQIQSDKAELEVWREIGPMLDVAMAGLNEMDRQAVVLRFFDGKSMREIGRELGVNEEAAKKRVQRGLEKLRRFFIKRSIGVSGAVLESAISANSIQAAPMGLAKSISAVAFAKGATASSSTLTLMKGAMKLMAWTKAKTSIVVGIFLVVAAGSSAIAIHKFGHNGHKPVKFADIALKQFGQSPAGALALDAVKFITSLKLEGRLPGIARNTPAGVEIPWFSLNSTNGTPHFSRTNIESYPVSLTITVHANDVRHLYYYAITKTSGRGSWQMLKAWRSDTNGIVSDEYPVP